MAALCARLHKLGALAPPRGPGEAREDNQVFASPQSLFTALAENPHFRPDTALGGILHGRKIAFGDVSPSDSLHVVFHGNQVSAHVDLVSPLSFDPQRPLHYAPARVVHNLAGAAGNLIRLIGRGAGRGGTVELALGTGLGAA